MIISSEQVSVGHPDKICDQISDAILTECLKFDQSSRVAVETLIKDNHVVVAGEISTRHYFNLENIVRQVVEPLGMKNVQVTNLIGLQSPDIALGVDTGGAGDQGMMFGYATDETPEYLPLPYVLATRVLETLQALKSPFLLSDAKAQVSYDYDKKRIDTFLVSIQHTENASRKKIKAIVKHAMKQVAKDYKQNTDFKVLVNPTGRFVLGGSYADAGVTGRKIIADTYGGFCRHGGGAFSGKDPSKVDRSGAYMARKIAKDIVREGYAKRCEVQLAYAIGVAEPVSVHVETFGTSRYTTQQLEGMIRERYELTPRGIIKELHLLNVDYTKTSCFGHFTKAYLPWEK
ncbi:methionine adenosyltransferase [Streptococcus suis]|uniref:methionine adenosyltransferase n=1 Tax=Streptococcus suis TaxID=1307 RepID=UPI001EE85A12|nr:methionine adenosyltransferase [Streptococcus suis]MBS7902834.1 methionine adenosyltransferase [Streptococcus suis]MDG3248471.1 methionine adenosyltransferase [Streptococcus suis]MDG3250004.1 methionine adenosyltransferase [Streptococcus suis]MDG3287208.1 methionine adenosyltransferase [Streptococcus suis]MDG3331881.1 methionine adenosyltransferase [Streptococcus suis]